MKTILIATLLAGFSFSSCSQNISASKVPSVVVNTLQAKYPSATGVDWEKTKTGYEAELFSDSAEVATLIDPSGKILAQKWEVNANQLPAPLLTLFAQQYAGYKIDDAEKIEKEGAVYYQVELDKKRKKEVKLVLDANGEPMPNTAFWD